MGGAEARRPEDADRSDVVAAGRQTTPDAEDVRLQNVRLGSTGPLKDVMIIDGRIAAVDDPSHREPHSRHRVFDAAGRTLLPGLWDAHVHSEQWAAARRRFDVSAAQSAAEAAAMVGDHICGRSAAPDETVVGYGFRDGLWPDTPDKSLLQDAVGAQSVLLVSHDLHTAWLSPGALLRVGLGDHPTGIVREDACLRVTAELSQGSTREVDRLVVDALKNAAARGVTGVIDFEYADNVSAWRRRAADGVLAARVSCAVYPDFLDQAISAGLRTGDHLDGGGLTEVGPLKIFVDGSLNTRTAYCHDPYPGRRSGLEDRGLLVTPPDLLARLMAKGARHGLEPAVHAIGDLANSVALDAFERTRCRGRIEHAQLLSRSDVARFARLDITVGIQPAHLLADRDVAERQWAGRTDRSFAYADLLAAGARLEIGSDAPVAPLDPWDGIAAAVSRTNDDRPPWHPEQTISLAAALEASARGRRLIRVGEVADLVLLDRDPADLPATDLRSISVCATILGGRWTHGALDG